MDLRAGMDMDLLLALQALLATGNVTHAADKLGISQPALSARLTRLRALFGDKLFIPSPTGRGVLPTPRASALAPKVASVLEQFSAMLEPDEFDPAASARVFTIATHENPAVMLGPDLINRIQTTAPHMRVRLALPDMERMPALLETGAIDIFIGLRAGADKAWIAKALFDDEFLTAQRKGHPRGTRPMTLDAFCDVPHLLVSSAGDPFSGFIDRALAEQGRKRSVIVSIQSYATAPAFIAGSDMLCTLPRRLLQQFAKSLDLFEPPVTLKPIQISAYWHPRRQDDPAHRWLRNTLFEAASATLRH